MWEAELMGSHYRLIEKTVSTKVKHFHSSRHKDVVITRLRLGKCCLNAYLCQIGKHRVTLVIHRKLSLTFSHNVLIIQHA